MRARSRSTDSEKWHLAKMIRSLFSWKPRRAVGAEHAKLPDGVRIYAVGDIHGCSGLLDRIHALIEQDLDRSRPVPDARLIYLGDYVDRGLDSAGVLDRLTGPPVRGLHRTLLRGNHEELLLQFLEIAESGPAWRQLGGIETLMSYRVNVRAILAERGYGGLAEEFAKKIPADHLRLLQNLPASVTVGGYFFCHAGVRPGIPLDRQKQQDLLWIREEFLTSTADFGKVVVHGHSPTEEPEFRSNRINIDTGAYATNRLTCLVLEDNNRRILPT